MNARLSGPRAEIALYADRLLGDLASLQQMLNNYTSETPGVDPLDAPVNRSMRQLGAISRRLDALDCAAPSSNYRLSDQEHAALDAARALRTRMMNALSVLQDLERSSNRPRS